MGNDFHVSNAPAYGKVQKSNPAAEYVIVYSALIWQVVTNPPLDSAENLYTVESVFQKEKSTRFR